MSTSDNCGCCAGVTPLTPVDATQPPGQPTLALRVGTHGRFRQSMLADLADEPALEAFTTRADDDPAIALLDSWAAVLDVLSFYQERIGNENYLRTATERRSVLELARAIGYELRPGVAASTWLSFTLETALGAPLETRIDIGTRAQSVPGQDEKAQTFETLEAVDAKARWNALPVLAREAVAPRMGLRTIYLAGTATRLQAGDALLIVGDERAKDPGNENWDFRRVARLRKPVGGLAQVRQPTRTTRRTSATRSSRLITAWANPGTASIPPGPTRAATPCAPAPTCSATTRRTGGPCRPTCAPPTSAWPTMPDHRSASIRNGLASRWPTFPTHPPAPPAAAGYSASTTAARASANRS